jgi:hypothetical protein
MNPHEPVDDEAVQQAADRLVENRLRLARQDEVMAIYEDLLRTIWDRIVPTLGRVTVSAILDRSIATTAENHPFVQHLTVTRDGLSFQALRAHLGDQEQHAIRDGMKELVANLIDLLAVLTGDIIVRRLLKEVEGGR